MMRINLRPPRRDDEIDCCWCGHRHLIETVCPELEVVIAGERLPEVPDAPTT